MTKSDMIQSLYDIIDVLKSKGVNDYEKELQEIIHYINRQPMENSFYSGNVREK